MEAPVARPHLRAAKLGLVEAIALSVSIVAPTMAMAFNVSLAANVGGRAAPLAFALGTLILVVVGLSFVAFSRRISHVGSAYAYIGGVFGHKLGFVAGWALFLTYLTYATGTAALSGNFVQQLLLNMGLTVTWAWIPVAIVAMALAWYLAHTDIKLSTRLTLALEGVSVLVILALSAVVLSRVGGRGGLSLKPFAPDPGAGFGWSGVGFALIFTVLSFAGFEGAATLGEETAAPRRSIPIAILGSVVLAGSSTSWSATPRSSGSGSATYMPSRRRAPRSTTWPIDTPRT